MKADRDVFAWLLIVSGKREISPKEVLSYSSLATSDGSFTKTVKQKLFYAIEKEVEGVSVGSLTANCVRIFDGMVISQQLPALCLAIFGEISEYVLKRITSHSSKVIYFVTDI